MSNPIWNPSPSDYAGQFRLAGITAIVAVGLLILGLALEEGCLQGLLLIVGVSLVVGSGAIALTAHRSRTRAKQAKDG